MSGGGDAGAPSAQAGGAAAGAPACPFCRIVTGAEPASVVHADDDVVAFLDVVPVNTGHVLVVPRAHATGLADLPEAAGAAVWRVAHRIGARMRQDPAWADGVNLHLSDGEAAHQTVGHVHLHVIPRRTGDGLRIVKDGATHRPARDELDAVAARLRQALHA